jgi:hypothetical protein
MSCQVDFDTYVSGFNAGGTRNECHKHQQQEHATS